jgi:hypothetical protein
MRRISSAATKLRGSSHDGGTTRRAAGLAGGGFAWAPESGCSVIATAMRRCDTELGSSVQGSSGSTL